MTRALVLSGGGSVGAAWETGLVAALQAGGVDLAAADLVVGTSAGSAVGVQVAAGHDMASQVERYRAAGQRAAAGQATAVLHIEGGRFRHDLFDKGFAAGKGDPVVGKEIGQAALAADVLMDEAQVVRTYRYLAGQPWPPSYVATCLDCDSGEFVGLDAAAGVPLERGVAASCSIPGVYAPVSVGGRRLADGGVLSPTHLDLAVGHEVVLFVAVVDPPPGEREAVEVSGAQLMVIEPDEASRALLGGNAMDAANAYEAVELGLAQGRALAADVAAFWG